MQIEVTITSAIHDEAVAVASFHAFQREIGGQLIFHYRLFSDLRSATSDGRPKPGPHGASGRVFGLSAVKAIFSSSVCRLACRASNKLPRTSLSVGRARPMQTRMQPCSRAYVAIMRRACALAYTPRRIASNVNKPRTITRYRR